MESNDNSGAVFRFGPFELNSATLELRRNGNVIRLQEKPFRFLLTLVKNAGRLVTRPQLREGLWPADTFVDFDRNLNAAVKRLREVLDDSAREPQFIETVPRRGYRFIGEVEQVGDEQRSPAASNLTIPMKSPQFALLPSSRRWLPTALAILAALSIGPSVLRAPSGVGAGG